MRSADRCEPSQSPARRRCSELPGGPMSAHAFGAWQLAAPRKGHRVGREARRLYRAHPTGPGTSRTGSTAAAARGRQRRHRPACTATPRTSQQDTQTTDGEVILDVILPRPPAEVCRAIFGSASLDGSGGDSYTAAGLYAQFLEEERGCLGVSTQPWGPASPAGARHRVLRYSTQLSARQRLLLPFGPAAVPNQEEQLLEMQHRRERRPGSDGIGSSGGGGGAGGTDAILVSCTCASSGVPFADAFVNELSWRLAPVPDAAAAAVEEPAGAGAAGLTPAGGGPAPRGSTWLLVAASCRFTKPVIGPLRGQIESESMQGMRELHAAFRQYLQLRCSSLPAPGISNTARSTLLNVQPKATPVQLPTGLQGEPAVADVCGWEAAQSLAQQLVPPGTAPDAALRQVAAAWPAWNSAGCRLRAGRAAPACPSPAQAAAVLQAVARCALRLPMAQRQQDLARHRVVRGLVAALRLPSPPPHQPALTQRHAAGALAAAAAAGSASAPEASASPAERVQAPRKSLSCPPGSPAAVSAALWSLAALGGSLYWLDEAEALCALLPACRFTKLHQVSDAVWALGTMRHHTAHLPLLEEQAVALLQQQLAPAAADEGSAGSGAGRRSCLPRMSSALWGLATLGHCPSRLLDLLPAALPALPAQHGGDADAGRQAAGRLPALASAGWSVAAAGCLRHPAVAELAAELAAVAAALQPPAAPKKVSLLQLHQFALALQQEAEVWLRGSGEQPHAIQSPEQQPAVAAWALLQRQPAARELLAAAAAAWAGEAGQRGSKQVSACQADVASTARCGLGIAVHEESIAAGLSVDMALAGQRLAIEVDGPSHFCRNGGSRGGSAVQPSRQLPTGGTLLKRRLLQRAGWKVASVSAADWEQLRSAAQKRAYLGAAIAAAERDGPAPAVM